MSKIDSENIAKPAPEAAKPRMGRPPRRPNQQPTRGEARSRSQQQEGQSNRDDEARQGRQTPSRQFLGVEQQGYFSAVPCL